MKNSKEYNREWKRNKRLDPEFRVKELEKNKLWREKNKEKISTNKKEYYQENIDKILEKKKVFSKERIKRKAQWDCELNLFVRKESKHLRDLRTEVTGIKWSVDHIIPLKGRTVSGLDVWNNIQVIPLVDNKRKHNLYEDRT